MALFHTEDQTMLKDMAAPFLAEHAPVKHLRQSYDFKEGVAAFIEKRPAAFLGK